MTDGIINLDTPRAKQLGFTSDRFDGYLWKQANTIIISFIVSKQKGNFRSLVQRILSLGYSIKVPTPLGRMYDIVRKNGYEHSQEPFSQDDPFLCDVWTLSP